MGFTLLVSNRHSFVIVTWLSIWILSELGSVGGYFSPFTLIKHITGIAFFTVIFAVCGGGFHSLWVALIGIFLVLWTKDIPSDDE